MAGRKFFKRPQKKETLQKKVEVRNYRRLLLHRGTEFRPEKWVNIGEVLFLLFLVIINFWLLLPFFGQPDEVNIFSAPLIPVLANLTSYFIPFAYSVRLWLLVFFLGFPLAYYFFIKEITKRKMVACLAVLIASLPIGMFLTMRIRFGLLTDDGSHIASYTLTALTCLFLLRFLKNGHFEPGLLSSLGFTLVALTSPLGLIVLYAFSLIVVFSEVLLGQGRIKILRFLLIIILACGFSAFWYNPKFVFTTIGSSQGMLVKKALANLLPVSFFAIPLLGIFGYLLFENRPQLQSLFIAIFLSIGFGLLSLGSGIPLSQPSRFLPVFGISLAFLIGVIISGLYNILRPLRRKIANGLVVSSFIGLVLMLLFLKNNLLVFSQSQVLGLTNGKKAGVWLIKEKVRPAEGFFGYGITLINVLGVVILKKKLKQLSGSQQQ